MTRRRFAVFPKGVADLLAELIDGYGVRYRLDRNERHIYLYGGDGQRPFIKVSSSRPEEMSIKYIRKWAEKSVDQWTEN